MRTEYGSDPWRPRAVRPIVGPARRRWPAAAVVALLILGVLPAALGEDGHRPPWRDAEEAARQLADAQVRLLDARDALVEAEERLVSLRVSEEAKAADTLVIASELQAAQERARRLAVEAYVSGGSISEMLYMLDAATAVDFAFRTTLLSESAEAVARTQEDYAELRAQASQDALDLAAEIDRMAGVIERAEQQIVDAERALEQAEWVMSIAEIHRAADELMARYGRVEPTAEQWDRLRFCESTRNYEINTGNSYYGAYQFNIVTWVDMGGSGLPSDAPPEEQDARARYLYALRGSGFGRGGAWPVCGRFLD